MTSRTKSLVTFGLKALVAATLIGWLVRSGVLKFGALMIFLERPSLLVADLALFSFAVLTTTLRWRALLGLAGARISFVRALQLQMTAIFFNVVIPGSSSSRCFSVPFAARMTQTRLP